MTGLWWAERAIYGGGQYLADLWERRKKTSPPLVGSNIVRGCNMSPIRVILFPDKTKKRVRKESYHLLNATNRTSESTTCRTVLTALYATDNFSIYRRL